jgi:hypothetical protein
VGKKNLFLYGKDEILFFIIMSPGKKCPFTGET